MDSARPIGIGKRLARPLINGMALSMAFLTITSFTVTASASARPRSIPNASLSALAHKSYRGTYAYTCCTWKLGNTIYHPGGLLVIHWIRYPDSSPPGEKMLLDATLIGPFHSVSDLKQKLAQSGRVSGVTRVRARSITVDNTVPRNLESAIHIPKAAKPGFYDLQTGIGWINAGGSGSGGSVIKIAG